MQAKAPYTETGDRHQRTREETMTSIVWANILLVMPFILIWVGVPLWLTVKHQAAPGFSEAHAYLAAKQRQAVPQLAG
jgi:hypothetical protein